MEFSCYKPSMGELDEWRRRLREACDADGRSDTDISIAAGLSHGYLHTVFRRIRPVAPTIPAMLMLAKALKRNVNELIGGLPVSEETAEWMQVWADMTPEKRDAWLKVLRELPKKPPRR